MKVRYDLIPSPWPKKPLGEIALFKDNLRRPVKEADRNPGPYPYYGANGQVGTIDGYIFDEPLVLLAEDGGFFDDPVRPIAYRIEGKTWVNNHAHVLAPTDGIDTSLLAYQLGNYDIRKYLSGSTRAKLTKSSATQIPIIVPPLPEQRRIVDILNRANGIRRLRREAQEKARQVIPALFVEMFGDPQRNPKGWPVRTIADLGRVQLGRQRTPKYQTGKHTRPYMRVANVFEDRIDTTDVLSMDFDASDFRKYKLGYGDILLNEGQSTELVGRPAMWRDEITDCCFQNTLVRFQSNREIVLPEFALAALLHYYSTGILSRISSKTSNVAHLGAGRFSKLHLYAPDLLLQQAFASRAADIQAMIAQQERMAATSERLVQSLMAEVFGG